MSPSHRHHACRKARRSPQRFGRRVLRTGDTRGQAVVEFALVLVPLMLLLLSIIQLGLIFNGYVTLTNAVREGARSASIYVYDRTLTKSQNDAARAAVARKSLVDGLNLLTKTAPQLAASEPTMTYSIPAGTVDGSTRVGEEVTIHVHYTMDLMFPLIAQLLPLENGRLPLDAEMTVVIN